MIQIRKTLYGYLAKLYVAAIGALLAGLIVVMGLFDSIEGLRILGKSGESDLSLALYFTALKIPANVMLIAPFVVLFAALWVLATLAKRQEFIIMRISGGSLWQLLTPLFLVALVYGGILVAAVHPLAAATTRAYDQFRERVLDRDAHQITLVQQGLWLRQRLDDDAYFILHADRVHLPDWVLTGVMVLYFDGSHQLLRRFDADTARLMSNAWVFDQAVETSPVGTRRLGDVREKTTLTPDDLENRFLAPDTISVWHMPRYIRMFQATGFSSLPLQMQFGGLLALPLLCAALVLIASIVALRHTRAGNQGGMILTGVVAGFLVFFAANFLHALGASGQIPIWMAALAPAFLTAAVGSMTLLSIEDQ
jgi:lipopolysaccharide export system permease protein